MILNMIRGFCMALADSVPGVSGSTVAFILGFYDRFINSLHLLFRGQGQERKDALLFLVKLAIGWVIGMVIAMLALSSLFETHIYFMSSLFLGLTVAAIPFILRAEKDSFSGHLKNLPFTLIGLAVVVSLTLSRDLIGGGLSVDYSALSIGAFVYLFVCGAVAICAMVLPGISGSTVLLILGVYVPTVTAVRNLLHLDFSVTGGIIVFALGAICGAVFAIHFLNKALENHRSAVIYLILGLLIGSLVAIVMGPTTLAEPHAALGVSTFNLLAFIIGIAILAGLEGLQILLSRSAKS